MMLPRSPVPLPGPRFTGSSGVAALPQDQRQQLLAAFNAHPAVRDLRHWLNDSPKIMSQQQQAGALPLLTYTLPGTQETISCVFWRGKYHITGTDIVKILRFRFACLGKPVGNMKKFEEGVFSDLRNLKAGEHATLEEPKSEFLEFLYKHNCIRTQKKQKVFYWYEVHHDDLVLEAFERDAKRHNQAATISSFLRTHNMNMGSPMMGGPAAMMGSEMMPGCSPRLMPRQMMASQHQGMYMSPLSQAMYNNSNSPMYAGNMMGYGGEWDQSLQQSNMQQNLAHQSQQTVDPAMDFLNSMPLEDNLLISLEQPCEPAPKSPRLDAGRPVASIDPSLIAALPSKAQRKVRHHAQLAETRQQKITVMNTNSFTQEDPMLLKGHQLRQEDMKDPLMLDPFNLETVSGSTFDFDAMFSSSGTNFVSDDTDHLGLY